MDEEIEELKIHNELILKLLDILKDGDLKIKPFKNAGSIGKQFRHIITINEIYYDSIVSGELDFYRKNIDHTIENDLDKLKENLKKINKNIINYIENMDKNKLNRKYINCEKSIKYISKSNVSPEEIIMYIIEHNIFHEGELTLYIREIGKKFPENWMIWGLK